MSLNATVKARVDENVKLEVSQILHDIGLNTSQAINIFLKRVIAEKGIPFELKIPNEKTIQAMQEAKDMNASSKKRTSLRGVFSKYKDISKIDLEENISQQTIITNYKDGNF